jgi:4-amino-4-deoxy-L-arabinose transferase-like glycosyltransferase
LSLASKLRTLQPLQALVACQLAVILATGLIAAAKVDIFSDKGFGDEPAHLAYVQTVADDHRLPVLGQDKISREIAALRTGRDVEIGAKPPKGLSGEQYEAFQPPLYYLVAAPVFLVTDHWFTRVRLVRALGLFFLFVAAFVIYHLAKRVLPEAHLIAFSAALVVLMWPGVVVMSVTVSNASLEVLAVCALVYALWRADSESSARWLLLSGVAVGLGVLTKITVVALTPLFAIVAARYVLRASDERRWLVGAAAVAIPAVLVAPWLVFNLDHYDALTSNGLAKEIQAPVINPAGLDYGFARFWSGIPDLFSGMYPLEWLFGLPPSLPFLFDFVKAVIFGAPVLLWIVEPRWLRSRHTWLLVTPFVLGAAMIAYSTVVEDWPLTLPRYLYPALPALALFTALSWTRLLRVQRASIALATLCALVGTVAWVDSVDRYLL